jgi:hypothetical protein
MLKTLSRRWLDRAIKYKQQAQQANNASVAAGYEQLYEFALDKAVYWRIKEAEQKRIRRNR